MILSLFILIASKLSCLTWGLHNFAKITWTYRHPISSKLREIYIFPLPSPPPSPPYLYNALKWCYSSMFLNIIFNKFLTITLKLLQSKFSSIVLKYQSNALPSCFWELFLNGTFQYRPQLPFYSYEIISYNKFLCINIL